MGNSPNEKIKVLLSPLLITFARERVPGLIRPTTCGRSELNLISLPLNSVITSPGKRPPLSADSPFSTSLISAPNGLSIPSARARSLSTSATRTPR